MQHYMTSTGTDLELLGQFHIYETVLRIEDGECEISRFACALSKARVRDHYYDDDIDERMSLLIIHFFPPLPISFAFTFHARSTEGANAAMRNRDIDENSAHIYDSTKKTSPRLRIDTNSRRKSIRHRMLSENELLKVQQQKLAESPPSAPPPPPPPPPMLLGLPISPMLSPNIAQKIPQLPLAHMLRQQRQRQRNYADGDSSSSSGGEQLEEFADHKAKEAPSFTPSLRRRLEDPDHLNNLLIKTNNEMRQQQQQREQDENENGEFYLS